jgi:hypothetical protein
MAKGRQQLRGEEMVLDGTERITRAEKDERQAIASAVDDTENEIYLYALGEEELDNNNDRTLEDEEDPITGELVGRDDFGNPLDDDDESGEDKQELVDPDEVTEVDPAEVDEGLDDQQIAAAGEQPSIPARDQAMLPSWRRPAGQGVDPEVAALRERLARLEGQQQAPRQDGQQQEQRPAADAMPDPVLDPNGFMQETERRAEARAQHAIRTERLETNFRSMEAAYDREGRTQEFLHARSALGRLGDNARQGNQQDAAIVRSIINAADPAYALMEWAENNLDLSTFREAEDSRLIEQAARRLGISPEALQELATGEEVQPRRADAGRVRQGNGEQRPAPQNNARRLPSLNSAGSASGRSGNSRDNDARGFDGSEGAIFDYALTN